MLAYCTGSEHELAFDLAIAGAVSKHVANVFMKLGFSPADERAFAILAARLPLSAT